VLDVYTWQPNANSGKPLLCLKEKGVAFTYHYIDMGKMEQHSPEYLKINPNGTIPAVVHDGEVMIESTPAMEYIDRVFDGPSLAPADAYEQWRMRWWCRYLDTSIVPALAMVASNVLAAPRFAQNAPEDNAAALERIPLPERRRIWAMLMQNNTPKSDIDESQRRIAECIALMEETLAERDYLAADTYSLADIVAMASLYGWPVQRAEQVNVARTPALMAWLARCHARPGIQAAFALGSPALVERVREVRQRLGVAEAD
jgi:GST-like protein